MRRRGRRQFPMQAKLRRMSLATVRRAVDALKTGNWIQVVQVGAPFGKPTSPVVTGRTCQVVVAGARDIYPGLEGVFDRLLERRAELR